jgi:exonuclease III
MIEKLSIFYWNARGLNPPARREAFRDMIQSVNPKLVCLQETKLSQITPQLAIETLGQRFLMTSVTCQQTAQGGNIARLAFRLHRGHQLDD